ncbi:MAG: HAD family hydrolase [Actinomycetaceae bacterium]|nr:HAD family hydrolase [Actinomycetaceae bacterium]
MRKDGVRFGLDAAIIDVDGTLLDTLPFWDEAPLRYLATLGLAGPPDLGKRMYHMSVEDGARYVHRQFAPHMTVRDILAGQAGVIHQYYAEEAKPKPGACDFVRALAGAGVELAILTASRAEDVEAALTRLGLRSLFTRLDTVDTLGVAKSDSLIFSQVAQHMGYEPSTILVADDDPQALAAAHAAGCITLGVYDPASDARQQDVQAFSDIYRSTLHSVDVIPLYGRV